MSRKLKSSNNAIHLKHVAIIMDGNGRWAKRRGLPRIAGHWAGAETLREILEYCSKNKIKILTVFAFSSENWKRPFSEVNTILNLLLYYLKVEANNLHKNNIRITISGDWEALPPRICDEIKRCIGLTQNNTGTVLNVALNYGGRNEILRACKRVCSEVLASNIKIDKIDEKTFEKFLYNPELPDPDLLIRPSGELRISNFLLWQAAYTEFWFTDTLWPDFTPEELAKAIRDYQLRDRRYGGLKKQNR